MHVQVIQPVDRAFFQEELEQFFRARHRVYAEELRWVPPSPTRLEYDQFDTDAATYLLVLDDGALVAGSRMISTDHPHMLSEVFPHTVTFGTIPRDPRVIEWTRGFIVPEHREGGGLKLKAACSLAVMEYCLAIGANKVGGIQEAKWLAIWRRMGFTVECLGEPVNIGGDAWLPAYVNVSPEALALAQARAGFAAGARILAWGDQSLRARA
jgi:acyl-homoserine lactone synthase